MKLAFGILRWVLGILLTLILLLMMTSCTMLGLNYASLDTAGKPGARPAITAATLADWKAQRPALLETFAETVYGPWPEGLAVTLLERRMVDPDFHGGALEDLTIELGTGPGARRFQVALATPPGPGPAPLIISQTFSDNCNVFPKSGVRSGDGSACEDDGSVPGLVTLIFGEFIAKVPVEQVFDRGYAYASFRAGSVVPDSDGPAQEVMANLQSPGSVKATGAVAAWAYGYSAIIDVLEADPGIDQDRIAVLGHSRHGKSALVAGVHDRRIDAVIAHQSGFGGAASSRSDTGETLKRMIDGANFALLLDMPGYPHWFAPAYADYAGRTEDLPVDQHQYLALLAPTPVLLGNGRRDVWSDPNSTYRMAEGADGIYELYGTEGLDQDGMRDLNLDAPLSFYMRAGGHAITQRDITTFLDFLDVAIPTEAN